MPKSKASPSNDAFERLLPVVHRIARRLQARGQGYDYEDLVQAGTLGLLDALERHEDHAAIEGLAVCRIQGAMLDYMRSLDPLSRRQRRRVRQVTESRERLQQRMNAEPSDSEVAADAGLSERDCLEARLDANASKHVSVRESFIREDSVTPAEAVERYEAMVRLSAAMDRLDTRLRDLIRHRYFDGQEMAEIARSFDVTPSRVSQLHRQALDRLKRYVQDSNLPPPPMRPSRLPFAGHRSAAPSLPPSLPPPSLPPPRPSYAA